MSSDVSDTEYTAITSSTYQLFKLYLIRSFNLSFIGVS